MAQVNAQGRIQYEFNEELKIWIQENEYKFLTMLEVLTSEKDVDVVWNEELFPQFKNLKDQNAFIKRMIKYGIIKPSTMKKDGKFTKPCNIINTKYAGPLKLHLHSGHNLEHWIRDHWKHYSSERIEVVTVKGLFDTPDHHRLFFAKENTLHSYRIDANTDEQVFAKLKEIEEELSL